MRRLLVLLAGALTLLVLVAACGGDDEEEVEAAEPAAAEEAPAAETEAAEEAAPSGEPIKIGASLPLTGDFSEPGKEAERGYRVWERFINERGGLLGRPVELIIRDDASDQNTVVADYNGLIAQDDVDLLFGTFSSFLNLPASAVAERNEMLYVEPAGGSPEMFDRGFHFLFFAQQAVATEQATLFAEWVAGLPEDQRPKTAAYPSQDDPFTAPVIGGVRERLEAAGIETVFEEIYPPDTTNFDTIANAIKRSGAELVAHGAVFNDGVGLVRSLQKVDFSPQVFFQTTAPNIVDQYRDAVGAENAEGVFSAVSYSPEAGFTDNEEFLALYEEMFGGLPAEDAADAFAVAQVVTAAVEAVGSLDDQRALADWLHANEVQTILGPLTWDEAGRPQSAFLLGQWQGGEEQIVLPEEAATSDAIVHPKPPWGG